jgi:protein-S-isoprenylcysteine O-methyltransferase Ste14
MSSFMLIAIRYEERDLTTLFGDDYRRYRSGVGMLIPRFGRRSA